MEREEARRRLVQQLLQSGGQMGMNVAADPLAYAGGASVVPPPNYQTSYNPAGAYAEAGRTVPNYASDWARGMNQVGLPQGGDPSDLHGWDWNNPYGRPTGYDYGSMPTGEEVIDMATGLRPVGDASVVAPPRMPTERETLDREVMGPADDRDRAFSAIHGAWAGGADFGVETEWSEGLGVPEEYVGIYMAVPDQAKRYAHENPTDAILQQFEEKYGFPLDISIDIP